MTKATVEVENAVYPRVYRPSGFWRIALILLGIAFSAGSSTGLWFAATGNFATYGSRVLAAVLCVLGVLYGAYCLLYDEPDLSCVAALG
jgi:hypothetical protein